MHPEFGPIAILSALSLFLPLPWHWRSGNVATLSIIAWLLIINVIFAVDAFIWSNNVDIVATLWCDITTKLIIGANFALPATCLCICIHLEQVSSVRRARTTVSDRKRRQIFEAGMCIGLPIVFMALHYIVQGHRFDIIEGYGCRPTTYFSVVAIFIIWIPPIVLSTAAIFFAGLALRHFMLRRLSFASHLEASNSALTTSRYIRLMTMAAVQMVWSITATSYALWFTVMAVPIRPWTTWADVHSDWLRVDQYPDAPTPLVVKRAFNVLWWIIPSSTLIFVASFAFGKDAMDEYSKIFQWIRIKVFRQQLDVKPLKSKSGFSTLPMSPLKSSSVRSTSKADSQNLYSSKPSDSSLPPYSASGSSFTSISKSAYYEDSNTESDAIHSPDMQGKALGSCTDLSIHTPSTIKDSPIDLTNDISPIPIPSRARAFILGPSPPRPRTYPTFDSRPQGIHFTIPSFR